MFTWIRNFRLRDWGGLVIGLLLLIGGLLLLSSKTYLGILLMVLAVSVPIYLYTLKGDPRE